MTDQQNNLTKFQCFVNEGQAACEFTRERRNFEQESPEKFITIRAALIEEEKSGLSNLSVDEIWKEAKLRHKSKYV